MASLAPTAVYDTAVVFGVVGSPGAVPVFRSQAAAVKRARIRTVSCFMAVNQARSGYRQVGVQRTGPTIAPAWREAIGFRLRSGRSGGAQASQAARRPCPRKVVAADGPEC